MKLIKLPALILFSSLCSQTLGAHSSWNGVTMGSHASRVRTSVNEKVDALFAAWNKGNTPGVFFVEGREEISLVFKRDEKRTVIGFTVRDGNSARKLP